MRIFWGWPQDAPPCVLAVGTFDGVHRGHQALWEACRQRAREAGWAAAALTFAPHPRAVLAPGREILCLGTVPERLAWMARFGLDLAVVLPFTRALADLSPEAFLVRLRRHLPFRRLVVGEDFHLGRGGTGDVSVLRGLGRALGFEVEAVAPVREADGAWVKSSRIREALARGDLEAVRRGLGRPYRLEGWVSAGDGRGRTLGFPTANLVLPPWQLLPAPGVYAARAYRVTDVALPPDARPEVLDPEAVRPWLDPGEGWLAAVNVGRRPTFGGGEVRVEAHLLDFEGELYGERLALELVAFLRPERPFPGPEALKEQLARDVAAVRARLGAG